MFAVFHHEQQDQQVDSLFVFARSFDGVSHEHVQHQQYFES